MSVPALEVVSVTHRYGSTVALNDISLEIAPGTLTGLLGPNGSGKTTLFRLLATLMPVQTGRLSILGHDVQQDAAIVREQLGVTFQSPAVDGRLTVEENLRCHGQLYGIGRRELSQRIHDGLARLGLEDRARDRVETLSGGLRRRVELAKGLLHRPRLLLLDEPSNGLDVLARHGFWDLVDQIRRADGTTVVVSTHLMDEAERCDRLFLLHEGQVVRSGAPAELQRSIDGERLTVKCHNATEAAGQMEDILGQRPKQEGDRLSLRLSGAAQRLPELLERLGEEIVSVEVAQASLDDVFIDATGRGLDDPSSDG